MKKTLLVTIDFPPMFGGVANYWANLLKNLPADKVVVLAPEYDNSVQYDQQQSFLIYRHKLLSRSPWIWPKWLPLLWRTYQLVKKEKIEQIIVTHILPAGTVAVILKKLIGIPFYISCHGLDVGLAMAVPRKRRLAKYVALAADGLIANSQYTADKLVSLSPTLKSKIKIIYPCPNIQRQVISIEKKQEFLRKYNLIEHKIILTVGRLISRKGQDSVIAAMPQILQAIPKAIYVVVGAGADLEKLKLTAEQNGVSGQVKFFTDILDEELPYFYESADVFIMPARQESADVEGFGIVYLEANIYGKPAIAGRSGGAAEAVIDHQTGLVVDPLAIADIARAVIELLSKPELAIKLGTGGAERVAKEFNWPTQARELLKVIQ